MECCFLTSWEKKVDGNYWEARKIGVKISVTVLVFHCGKEVRFVRIIASVEKPKFKRIVILPYLSFLTDTGGTSPSGNKADMHCTQTWFS